MFTEELIHVFVTEASAALESFLTDAASDELLDDLLSWAMACHEVAELDLSETSEVELLVRIDLFGFSEQVLELSYLGEQVGSCFLFHAQLLFSDAGFAFDDGGHRVAGCEEALLGFREGGEHGDQGLV